MIHYSCDMCGKPLEPDKDVRYVVKGEVYAVYGEEDDSPEDIFEDELDEFEDPNDDPELASGDAELEEDDLEYKTFRFDLCSECHSKFLQTPFFIKGSRKARFSEN